VKRCARRRFEKVRSKGVLNSFSRLAHEPGFLRAAVVIRTNNSASKQEATSWFAQYC